MRTQATFEVGIVAEDLDVLLGFYRDVLALSVVGDIEVPATISRKAGLAADGYRVVRLQTDRGDRIKLVAPVGGVQVRTRESLAMQRHGLCYLTFLVADLDALSQRLEDRDATVCSEGVVDLRPGVRMLLAADPEGNRIEFVQYDDIASYRPPAR